MAIVHRDQLSTSKGAWPTGTSRGQNLGRARGRPRQVGRGLQRAETLGAQGPARRPAIARGGALVGPGAGHRREQLDRAFFSERFSRALDALGYVVWRHWKVYGEEDLAGREAALWLRERTLTVEHAGEPLSRYVIYQGHP